MMALKMTYKTDEEQLAARRMFEEERKMWSEFGQWKYKHLDPLGARAGWDQAMAIITADDEISEDEAIVLMIGLLMSRGDLSIWLRHAQENFDSVTFKNIKFKGPHWRYGLAKAVIYSQECLKVQAKIDALKAEHEKTYG